MQEDGRTAANGSPETTTAVAERWRLPALGILRRWMPGRRWLQFAAAVEERHRATFVRSTPKRRDRGQGLAAGSQGLGIVPPRPAFDLTRMGGTRWAAEIDRRPFDAPAMSDRADRRARWRGSWPETEAHRPGPRREFRTAVPRRTADAQEPEARARPGDGRLDKRLPAGALHGLARTLEPHVQGYLSRLLDLRIPAVRIHTGEAADAAARRFNADAVSFGRSIMFRAGKFAPDSASGLGLLAHELTHVAHTESDGVAGSPGRAALAREELAAIENEKRVLQHATRKPAPMAQIAAGPREPTPRASRTAPAPRAASVDRGVAPPPAESGLSNPPELTAQQLGALKEAIYRDLMDRIRTEFERGA